MMAFFGGLAGCLVFLGLVLVVIGYVGKTSDDNVTAGIGGLLFIIGLAVFAGLLTARLF